MAFELWDIEASKYLGRFEDERDALVLVRTLVEHFGREYADKLDLGETIGEGANSEPLTGAALVDRAYEVLVDRGEREERDEVPVASQLSDVRHA